VGSWPRRLWARVVRQRVQRQSFYPGDEPRTGSERRRELVDEPKHPVDDFPSGDALRPFPPQVSPQ
jgi:hypothetical protein